MKRQVLFWCAVAAGICAPSTHGAGHYALAFWREAGAYENQAPPAGEFGNHSAFVHVWDESGQPLAGKQIYTSWGVLLGATDPNGFAEIELRRPNGYDFQIRDGAHSTDTTPIMSEERPPSWGHYSFEIGFMFKEDAGNPGVFDTNYFGTINASGADPCLNLSAPHTRSLAFYSTAASNYCSDAYALGNWAASHGQTFVATGNRIVAMKALMAAGFNVHHFWTVQILEGGPNGTPIGPARSTRLHLDTEYYPILVKWGVNDVQVVPGHTYFLKITRDEGINVFRVNANNYGLGNYFQDGASVSGSELMGAVLCSTYTNAGPSGLLTGFVRTTNALPLAGALVSVPDVGLYSTSDANGGFAIPSIPVGTYDVSAAKAGYVTRIRSGVVIGAGLSTTSNFSLSLAATNGDGLIAMPNYILQPFEAPPGWSSTFDATWGSAASFSIVSSGQSGNGLQAIRGGPGSSARAQVFSVKPNTPYQLTVWMRCPSFGSAYWMECGYRLGANTAQDFDGNASAWTLIKKFSDTGANGNGNIWTRYTTNLDSGASSQVSVGFKLGAATGTGPTAQWDQLSIVSLALPAVVSAVADVSSNITVRFAESVAETGVTNPANYLLTGGDGAVPILSAARLNETNVALVTSARSNRVDYTLTVSNITTAVQPAGLTGRNGQLTVRVPAPLLELDNVTTWRFLDTGANLGSAWHSGAFDDSEWPAGAPLFGYSSGSLPEAIRTPLATDTNRVTVYFRKRFLVPAAFSNALLRVRPVVDDGAVFWLNGTEMLRLGMSNGPVAFNTRAARTIGIADYEGPFDLSAAALLTGTNMLAVEVHQADPASPDVIFGTRLEALVPPSQLPPDQVRLAVSRQANAVTLTWSDPGLTLEQASTILGPWIPQPAVQSPVTIVMTNPVSFFRLSQ